MVKVLQFKVKNPSKALVTCTLATNQNTAMMAYISGGGGLILKSTKKMRLFSSFISFRIRKNNFLKDGVIRMKTKQKTSKMIKIKKKLVKEVIDF